MRLVSETDFMTRSTTAIPIFVTRSRYRTRRLLRRVSRSEHLNFATPV